MTIYIYILLIASSLVQLEATIQRDILTYINDLRHLHSAGPLISSPTITSIAQKSAVRLSKNGGNPSVLFNSQFSTNHCIFKGRLSHLAQNCAVSWYSTMREFSFCKPHRDGKARHFVNMLWNATTRAGIGVSQGKDGKYYVVVYFSPRKTQNVKQNVNPVKIVTQASPKAVCAKGYSRFGSSCFRFHPQQVTWEQAVIECAKENATLTSVRNKEEEKFLRILQERGKGKGWMWIGLHDRLHEGQFTWLDGLGFASGVCAPVTANGGSAQNCVAWTTNKPPSCWSDKVCSERHSFLCRMPIEGKLTYRVEILFKKFRWNPNFRNKLSKAFKDLNLGLKVTFKEIFQKSSGRIGGGLGNIKIKAVRPVSLKGRRRGTVITLSLQFRSQVADPTLKFQKFLRPSERLLGVTVDSPVIHKSSLTNSKCFFACRGRGHKVCPDWSYYSHSGYNTNPYTGYHNNVYHHTGYQNTGYHSIGYHNGYQHTSCPTACTQYSYTCPTYCPQSCCSQVKQGQSLPSKATPSKPTKPPTQAATVAKAVVNTVTAATTVPVTKPLVPVTQAPVKYHAQHTGYTSYQPYNQCNTCHLYSSPYCYTYCDESCCKHGKREEDLHETLADMRENLKKFQVIVNLGKNLDLPGFETEFEGRDVPLFGKKATLAVKTLQTNIEKLEAKIKRGEKQFVNKSPHRTEKESENLKTKDSNVLSYFDDELSDITDDFDINESNLQYPHMNVHSVDKNTELDNDFKHDEGSIRHPDSPQNSYENSKKVSANPTENVDNHQQKHSHPYDNIKNDFRLDEGRVRQPDSPPNSYDNSKEFTANPTENVDSYPQMHLNPDDNITNDLKLEEVSVRHPDSPPNSYENSKEFTANPTENVDNYSQMHLNPDDNLKKNVKLDKESVRHTDSPPNSYENSKESTSVNVDNYPQMHLHPQDNKDVNNGFKLDEGSVRHPDSPPNSYDNSKESTSLNVDNYPQMHLKPDDNIENGFKLDEGRVRHPDSPPNSYDNSKESTPANVDNYPQMHLHPQDNKDVNNGFNVYEGSVRHPDSPPNSYDNSKESTSANVDNYPQMHLHPQDNKDVNNGFKVYEGSVRHPDSPPNSYTNPKEFTAIPKADVDNYQQMHLHPYDNIKNDFKLVEGGVRHPDSPPDIYENSTLQAPYQNSTEINTY